MSVLRLVYALAFLFFILSDHATAEGSSQAQTASSFVGRNGKNFMLNGETLYFNGFNAYWMMNCASDPRSRGDITDAFQKATSMAGMNVGRAWAFNDGDYKPLQKSPGSYDEQVFQGLDFVVAEASKYKVYLILTLVNNWNDYGGKKKYVQWANLTDPDEFFTNPTVKQFYKNNVKNLLTRKNTITGVTYKDDPTILAWELINEARCNDSTTTKITDWAQEMASYAKSVDSNHMVSIGLEGFYGESKPDRMKFNPNTYVTGSDFLSTHAISQIDFANIHLYPGSWLPPPQNASQAAQTAFADKWIQAHIQDCDTDLNKPLLISEFGEIFGRRDAYFTRIYDAIYANASKNGSCAGGLFWQLMTRGTKNSGDGLQIVLEESPSITSIINQQSNRMHQLSRKRE